MVVPEPDFEEFFLANYQRLVTSLTVIGGDHELACDSVQDAFIKASGRWRRLRRYDDPAAWVRRVAINRSRDLQRAGRRRQRRETLAARPTEPTEPDVAGEISGLMELADLLSSLPERQRVVASLYYVEDMPVARVATSLDISEGTVKSHLSAARAALRSAVEADGTADMTAGGVGEGSNDV